jgi:hypothetical protein
MEPLHLRHRHRKKGTLERATMDLMMIKMDWWTALIRKIVLLIQRVK